MSDRVRILWDQDQFREIYAEVLAEFESSMLDTFATLRECNGNTDSEKIREYFERAHQHYKKATAFANHLSIMMGKRLANKPLRDWTWQQGTDNNLITALSGMLSSNMNHLLTAYSPFLRAAQWSGPKDPEEFDAS